MIEVLQYLRAGGEHNSIRIEAHFLDRSAVVILKQALSGALPYDHNVISTTWRAHYPTHKGHIFKCLNSSNLELQAWDTWSKASSISTVAQTVNGILVAYEIRRSVADSEINRYVMNSPTSQRIHEIAIGSTVEKNSSSHSRNEPRSIYNKES